MIPLMMKVEWPAITDDALVERLIPAIQKTIADACVAELLEDDATLGVIAPDTANAMLLILATLLEISPVAASSLGLRRVAGAVGKELLSIRKDICNCSGGINRWECGKPTRHKLGHDSVKGQVTWSLLECSRRLRNPRFG